MTNLSIIVPHISIRFSQYFPVIEKNNFLIIHGTQSLFLLKKKKIKKNNYKSTIYF